MAFSIFGKKSASNGASGDPSTDKQIDQIIGSGRRSEVVNNPNYRTFHRVNDDIATIINQKSIITQAVEKQMARTANPTMAVSFGEDFLALPVATNKNQRI